MMMSMRALADAQLWRAEIDVVFARLVTNALNQHAV